MFLTSVLFSWLSSRFLYFRGSSKGGQGAEEKDVTIAQIKILVFGWNTRDL